ncbi:MAG: hypothetical protein Kow0075_05270 [Salibacteraceae bacterium]
MTDQPNTTETKIEVKPNGPLLVHGKIVITLPDGTTETRENITALCRCGMSANKPFCDGTHKRENWQAS